MPFYILTFMCTTVPFQTDREYVVGTHIHLTKQKVNGSKENCYLSAVIQSHYFSKLQISMSIGAVEQKGNEMMILYMLFGIYTTYT